MQPEPVIATRVTCPTARAASTLCTVLTAESCAAVWYLETVNGARPGAVVLTLAPLALVRAAIEVTCTACRIPGARRPQPEARA